ncbi:hypothetical protein CFBP5499_28535 (plasmid) [Agrobacterium tumefaciens]|nr:hypothetical protein CFBP5499_28535 [Agrobacterium tumefaciens]
MAERLNDFGRFVMELWAEAPNFIPGEEIGTFAARHIALTRKYWAAESRCANWMITGPARFPVARNEKRMKVSDVRYSDISAHIESARKSVRRKAYPHGADGEPIRSGDPEALQRIASRIEALALSIDRMKAANVIIRRMEKKGATEAEILAEVMAKTGMDEARAVRGVALTSWQRRRSFDTTNTRAELRRMQKRLSHLSKMKERGDRSSEVETGAGKVEVKENAEAARIQLVFPGKPDEETRRILKGHGFRWSPSQGVWQRHLNEAGRYAAKTVLSKTGAAPAAA